MTDSIIVHKGQGVVPTAIILTGSSSDVVKGDGSCGAGGGGGTPASTVVTETAFGQSSAVEVGTNYAREDHTHGTPTNPITAHEAAPDPHPVYALDTDLSSHVAAGDPHPAYALDADLSAHEAAADPHAGYQKESEKNAANGYAGLGATSKLTGSQQVYGSALDTACQGNDSRLSDARMPTAHATSHKSGGADAVKLDELAAPTDVTTLNVSTTAHGLCPKLPGGTSTFLRADGAYAAPGGGSDPWIYVILASDFTTTSATAVDVTGLAFTPAASTKYEFEAVLMTRTATTTVGPRPGLAWPTGMTDGVARIKQTSSATAELTTNGNINAALLCAVGGLPTNTLSYPANIKGIVIAGGTPSGTVKVQLASETAGTTVTIKAGSFLKYRTYS